jgi:mono/diheme cytochrome c family protein
MKIMKSGLILILFLGVYVSQALEASESTTISLYQQHCAACHGSERLGGTGPALLPENLTRVRQKEANEVISKGRPASQMPGFNLALTGDEIQSLVEYIYTPLASIPVWAEDQIKASHIVHYQADELAKTPQYNADPLNLFLVVELGDHHVSVLDGDRLEPIHRFKSRHALHGGPKYTANGRYVYFASRDGWISKFDMYNLKTVA